ncbi:MAG: hypothetical protein QF738_04890 [Rhodospirillales bacterium]|nr:hypothetical protein [Rhodospirillales bacterium]
MDATDRDRNAFPIKRDPFSTPGIGRTPPGNPERPAPPSTGVPVPFARRSEHIT